MSWSSDLYSSAHEGGLSQAEATSLHVLTFRRQRRVSFAVSVRLFPTVASGLAGNRNSWRGQYARQFALLRSHVQAFCVAGASLCSWLLILRDPILASRILYSQMQQRPHELPLLRPLPVNGWDWTGGLRAYASARAIGGIPPPGLTLGLGLEGPQASVTSRTKQLE